MTGQLSTRSCIFIFHCSEEDKNSLKFQSFNSLFSFLLKTMNHLKTTNIINHTTGLSKKHKLYSEIVIQKIVQEVSYPVKNFTLSSFELIWTTATILLHSTFLFWLIFISHFYCYRTSVYTQKKAYNSTSK